ncbi:MAG: hypothetical protein EAZ92_17725 [Candidatus Kapaibacterium sp.]|nr:MAG: hypothetical protein EAZ92_17725 [Candidatus Kapabacteria bacterium]
MNNTTKKWIVRACLLGFCIIQLPVHLRAQTATSGKKGGGSIPAPTAPQSTPLQPSEVEIQVSVAGAGFMGWTQSGFTAGMQDGTSKLDAVQMRINTGRGGIWYTIYTSDGAWQTWSRNAETAQGKEGTHVQAIAMRLYDVPMSGIEYRVHQKGGEWLAWAKNGEIAGNLQAGTSIDAIDVRVQANAPQDASLLGDALPPAPVLAPTKETPPVAVSGKKTSNAPQTPSPSPSASEQPLPARIESMTAAKEPSAPVSTPKKTSPPSSANTPQNQRSVPQQTQQNQGQQNQGQQNQGQQNQGQQTDWGAVANTAGQVAGQALGGMNTGMSNANANNRMNTGGQAPTAQNWSSWTNQPMQRAQGYEQPVFLPIATRQIALLANNNRYISAMNDPRSGALFRANQTNVGRTEIFELAFLGEHRVALKTLNGRYLSVRTPAGGSLGSSTIAPVADLISTNEAFEMVSNANTDRIFFRAANGQFLSIEEFGEYRLFGKQGMAGAWEGFGVALPDGKPILAETSSFQQNAPAPNAWRTQQDANGRVLLLDQQGRTIEAADRVLLLVANSPNTAQNGTSSLPTLATTPSTANANTSVNTSNTAASKPASTQAIDPKTYLSSIELDVLQEINFARTKPSEYATMLEGYRKYYKGKTFAAPSQKSLTTKEGVKALDEAILALKMSRPMEALTTSQALSKAARDHVDNTGPRGLLGHVGTDKSNPNDRAARYGSGVVNENICYNRSSGREIIVRLLIDDGSADRGYRKNILNPAFTLVGTAFGLHKTQQTMCSQVFAASYQEK